MDNGYSCKVCGLHSYETSKIQGKDKAYCKDCDIWFPIVRNPKVKATMYLHGEKENNMELAEELGIEEDSKALETFIYSLYEVKFDVEVDLNTGKVMILAVNGTELKTPVAG